MPHFCRILDHPSIHFVLETFLYARPWEFRSQRDADIRWLTVYWQVVVMKKISIRHNTGSIYWTEYAFSIYGNVQDGGINTSWVGVRTLEKILPSQNCAFPLCLWHLILALLCSEFFLKAKLLDRYFKYIKLLNILLTMFKSLVNLEIIYVIFPKMLIPTNVTTGQFLRPWGFY